MTLFRLLGCLEITADEGEDAPARPSAPPKVRQLLVYLLLRANQVVLTDDLIEELWGERPPRSAMATLQTYMCHLRKDLGRTWGDGVRIETQPAGYRLHLAPDAIDVHRFRSLVEQAERVSRAGRHESALALLDQALTLWRGPALADVTRGPLLDAYAVHLEEERLRAQELRFDAAFALGLHRDQIAPLRALVRMHPLNEWLHGRLIEALVHTHRRGEALAAYHSLEEILDREMGVPPSEDVRQLQRQMLKVG
ncbi:putative actinorhodin operon activatory protein [Kineosporia sp. NBRC 101731]|nr:putative actinorhodin operon activatory protein [Kineosporia sp. NBRC 101731]